MKKTIFAKIITLTLAVMFVLGLTSCGRIVKLDEELEIKVSVLNGTTGFGMAKLMYETANSDKILLNYNFAVETDASVITAGLINGDIDIAALPTNAASVVYNKTNGAVKVLALNTLGVLYVVEKWRMMGND